MSKEIISRTVKQNIAKVTYLNADKIVVNSEIPVPERYNTEEKAEKFIRKNKICPDGWKIVCVDEIKTLSALVGMYIDEFMRYATYVPERSKETRDCVTKEIVSYYAHYEYLNGRDICEAEIRIPATAAKDEESADKYLRKTKEYYGKFIGTTQILTSKAIYALDENRFAELARPMLDRFHISEK